MQKFVLTLFSLIVALLAFAQNNAGIVIKVMSEENEPIQGATVELLKKDSSVVKIQVSDSAGSTSFENLTANDYLIRISRVGFSPYFSRNAFAASNNPGAQVINLQADNSNLSNVTVNILKCSGIQEL